MTTDSHADWDAAYLVGALSPGDRREFERHLEVCDACSAAVSKLAGLPGLLGKVPIEEVESLVEDRPLPVPATLLPRLVRSVNRHRRRVRAAVAGGLLAVAAAAMIIASAGPLAAPAGVPRPPSSAATGPILSLAPVVPSGLSADLRLVSVGWGTRLELRCRYAAEPSASPGYDSTASGTFALFVTDVDGLATEVATWTATPGSTVQPSGTTSLPVAGIRSIDVRSVPDGRVLLRGRP